MPRKSKKSDEKPDNSGVGSYIYFLMLFLFVGISVIMYTVVDGLTRVVGLPNFMATAFRGTAILSFVFMGLVLIKPLISK
jgi:hypothetical protein